MILNLLKKIWNDYSPIFIATIVTIITNTVVDSSDLQEAIASGNTSSSLVSAFVTRELLVFSISLFINVIIIKTKKYLFRYNIRKKKYNPLANKCPQEICTTIEQHIKESRYYFDEYNNHTGIEKIYFIKQSIYYLKEATYVVANIINYGDHSIALDFPSEDKFSYTDISWFCKLIKGQYEIINIEFHSFSKTDSYPSKEVKFIENLLRVINVAITDYFDKYCATQATNHSNKKL